jgi:hypothetical protein
MARFKIPDYDRLDDVDIYVQSTPMTPEEEKRLSALLKKERAKYASQKKPIVKNLSHQEHLAKQLQNSEFAGRYLATYLEGGTPEEIAAAISKILLARKKAELPKIYQSLFESNRDLISLGRV